MRAIIVMSLLLLVGVAACVSTPIAGARKPPDSWEPAVATAGCESVSGIYDDFGAPAPDNSNEAYALLWPVTGSLVSFAERGLITLPPRVITAVGVDADSEGHATFSERGAQGTERPLVSREWWCDKGALVTRAALREDADTDEHRDRDESQVRLWKAADGALIAENTLMSVTQHSRSSATHEPLVRLYFRFAAVTPSSQR